MKYIQKIIFSFYFVFVSIQTLTAQMFPYRQYTSEDELANSNVFDLEQDNEGFIWIATENGVSKFDGSKFTNYSHKDGLKENVFLSLAVEKNTIYTGSKLGAIYAIDSNDFQLITNNSKLKLGIYQLATYNDLAYSLSSKNLIYAFQLSNKNIDPTIVAFENNVKPNCLLKTTLKLYCGTSDGIYEITGLKSRKITIQGLDDKSIEAMYYNKGFLYASSSNQIYIIKDDLIIETIFTNSDKNAIINHLLIDSYGQIWYSTFPENKLYCYSNKKSIVLSDNMHLNAVSINDILQDNEGNVWVATYSKGVFCFHHLFCTNYTLQDGLGNEYLTTIENDNNTNFFIGTYDGISIFDNTTFTHIKFDKSPNEYINAIAISKDNISIVGSNYADCLPKKSTFYKGKRINYLYGSAVLSEKENNKILIGNWSSTINEALKNKSGFTLIQIFVLDSLNMGSRINKIYKNIDNSIWCGTSKGLYIIYPEGEIKAPEKYFLKPPVNEITSDNMGHIWIGSECGVYRFLSTSWDTTYSNIDNATSIAFDNKNRPWIGTLNGLYLIDAKKILTFNKHAGLLSAEVKDIAYNTIENALLVATNNGLSKINISQFDETKFISVKILFKNIRVAGNPIIKIGNDNKIDLDYFETDFTLRFSAIHFSDPDGVKFEYVLDNSNYLKNNNYIPTSKEWESTTGRLIQFAGLSYGKHTILVRSKNEQGGTGPIQQLTIFIATPFWVTWWFKLLVCLIIAGSIYVIVRFRIIRIKEKEKEKLMLNNKIVELRHQALTSSMNPHFIFNSLNSIQQFINTHNTEEASEYLGKFSRLIRMILESGSKSVIPLEEELERLNRYLELEKIRFGNKLTYTIKVDSSIDQMVTEVPNMIIQPFVENALWHGILPLQKNGIIQIQFTKDNSRLIVIIDDNGIGINASMKKKKEEHTSLSMQMIQERLQILNKLNNQNAGIVIQDKSELIPPAQGTKIIITF